MKSILEVKLKCPACGLETKVEDAIHDGESHSNGNLVFDSDGSLGCPFCFEKAKKVVYLQDIDKPLGKGESNE